jgi:RNA polymerase sigma-70 factor (ECF subfamily)
MNLEKVWRQYSDSLKAFLHANLSDAADVDDVLQEILLKTYQHISQLKDATKVKPWLFQIAHNSIIDFYRQQGKSKELQPDQLWYSQEESDIHQQLSQCMSPFIHALPDEEAQMLMSIELEGVSQKDYAKQHGMNYSTLKSRVQKARLEVLDLFQSCCQFTLDSQGRLVEYQRKEATCKGC